MLSDVFGRGPWFFWFGMCIWLAVGGSGCTAKVTERRCKTDQDCDGAEPSVCAQSVCVPRVCQVGKVESCQYSACALDENGALFVDAKSRCERAKEALFRPAQGKAPSGSCQFGKRRCLGAGERWSSCVGIRLPQKEVCDSLDNDCDGTLDNSVDCQCKPEAVRECPLSGGRTWKGDCVVGEQRCLPQLEKGKLLWRWGACSGRVDPHAFLDEVLACAWRDVNCDGEPDDLGGLCSCSASEEGKERACYSGGIRGKGSCEEGVQVCRRVGGVWLWGVCTGRQAPKVESCNGKDDDCDGRIDNMPGSDRILWEPCAKEKGCGVRLCILRQQTKEKGFSDCQARELCQNGRDDDCDGEIDESSSQVCCQTVELCGNNIDDNCDQRIDEQPCQTP